MKREEAIKLIDTHTVCFYNEIDSPTLQALHLAIEALSADAVKVAYICDSRACNGDCELAECTHTTDIEHAKNFIRHGNRYMELAEAEPTVIRSRTLMPTKDFKEWAKRVRETNPNVIVIPCDAEVVSDEAVSREEYEETDGVIKIKRQSAKDVGEIKHIVVCSPNYTRYFYNDSMPTQYKGGDTE